MGLSSRHSGAAPLAFGLRAANFPTSLAAVDGAQRDPAAAAAAASITGRMPGRTAQATSAAPQPPTGPKDPEHTALAKETQVCSTARPDPPRPRYQRFWPTRYLSKERPRRSRRRRRRAKAAPRRMLLPDSPYAGRPQRARTSLCAAPASRRPVGARRRLSPRLLPSAAQPSPFAGPAPAPNAEPAPTVAALGAGDATRFTATRGGCSPRVRRLSSLRAKRRDANAGFGARRCRELPESWILRAAAGLGPMFLLSERVGEVWAEIPCRPSAPRFPRGRHCQPLRALRTTLRPGAVGGRGAPFSGFRHPARPL